MTKEQAINFLNNKKVYVKDKSREIQEKLFSLGIHWTGGKSSVMYEYEPFLYIKKGVISAGSKVDFFYADSNKEITVKDILNITIEPKYRPFTSPVECWEEMSNHLPFGWLKRKNVYGDYILRTHICPAFDFEDEFNEYTFADGKPFGIKED